MDAKELNDRLVAVGEKIKAKGWKGASIDLSASYLGIFDRKQNPAFDVPRYCATIRATVYHSARPGDWSDGLQGFNASIGSDIKNIDDAVSELEKLADQMPLMSEESARIKAAKAKLTDSEKQLLGVR